jgi:hypothetical protein
LKSEVTRQIEEARSLMEQQSSALATGLTSGTEEARRLVNALENAVVQLQAAAERTRSVVDDTVTRLEDRLKTLPDRANQTAAQVRTLVHNQLAAMQTLASEAAARTRAMNEALEASMRAATGLNFAAFAPQGLVEPEPQAPAPGATKPIAEPALSRQPRRAATPSADPPAAASTQEPKPLSTAEMLGVPRPGPLSLSAESLADYEGTLSTGPESLRRTEKPLLEGLARRLTGNRNSSPPRSDAGKDAKGMSEILRAVDQAMEEDNTQGNAQARKAATDELMQIMSEMMFDLPRFFTERASDKFLTAYAAGDRALYTEYLLARAGPQVPQRIREHARDDAAFSAQVEHFNLLFEAELARAKASGQRAVVNLLSSDAGKLYVLIKGAIEGR